MRRPRRLRTLSLLAAWCLALPSAQACGYEGLMSDLTAQHPRSIELALALRASIERGELQVLEALPPPFGFLRANRTLRGFSPAVAGVSGQNSAPVAVLLVEWGLWTRYTFNGDGQAMAWPHVPGPQAGEAVLVTGEAVLEALVAGTLAPALAVERGLLLLSPPAAAPAGE